MYQKKITEDFECGIVVAMRVFCNKWKPCIIDAVFRGYNRPSEIHRQIPEAKPRVLDIQLKELLQLGVVTRQTGTGFPLHSKYSLTELGRSIVPVVQQLDKWGDSYKHELKAKLSVAV